MWTNPQKTAENFIFCTVTTKIRSYYKDSEYVVKIEKGKYMFHVNIENMRLVR